MKKLSIYKKIRNLFIKVLLFTILKKLFIRKKYLKIYINYLVYSEFDYCFYKKYLTNLITIFLFRNIILLITKLNLS